MNRLCKISEIESHSVLDQSEFGFLENSHAAERGKNTHYCVYLQKWYSSKQRPGQQYSYQPRGI